MIGPGAYAGRLPRWAMKIVRITAGDRVVRVPLGKIRTIGAAVQLQVPGTVLGLQRSEDRVAALDSAEGRILMRLSDLRGKPFGRSTASNLGGFTKFIATAERS